MTDYLKRVVKMFSVISAVVIGCWLAIVAGYSFVIWDITPFESLGSISTIVIRSMILGILIVSLIFSISGDSSNDSYEPW